MATVMIEARKRDKSGTRNARQYRREGLVPGVFYIDGKEAVQLLFDAKNLSNFLNHTRGLVELEIAGEKAARECVLKEVQYHPVTDEPLHVDFLGVKMDEKIEIQVPLILKGTPEGVKTGGMLEHLVRQLTIECFPGNIPNVLEVDVSGLAVGKSVRVGDLKYENITILNDPNETVALVELPKAAISELEEMPQEAEITEPEVIGKGKESEEQEERE